MIVVIFRTCLNFIPIVFFLLFYLSLFFVFFCDDSFHVVRYAFRTIIKESQNNFLLFSVFSPWTDRSISMDSQFCVHGFVALYPWSYSFDFVADSTHCHTRFISSIGCGARRILPDRAMPVTPVCRIGAMSSF